MSFNNTSSGVKDVRDTGKKYVPPASSHSERLDNCFSGDQNRCNQPTAEDSTNEESKQREADQAGKNDDDKPWWQRAQGMVSDGVDWIFEDNGFVDTVATYAGVALAAVAVAALFVTLPISGPALILAGAAVTAYTVGKGFYKRSKGQDAKKEFISVGVDLVTFRMGGVAKLGVNRMVSAQPARAIPGTRRAVGEAKKMMAAVPEISGTAREFISSANSLTRNDALFSGLTVTSLGLNAQSFYENVTGW